MKKEFFMEKCPLEIGDYVAVTKEEFKTVLYYLPQQNAKFILKQPAELARITDIAVLHYSKSGKNVWLYELNNSKEYIGATVKMPVLQYETALKENE